MIRILSLVLLLSLALIGCTSNPNANIEVNDETIGEGANPIDLESPEDIEFDKQYDEDWLESHPGVDSQEIAPGNTVTVHVFNDSCNSDWDCNDGTTSVSYNDTDAFSGSYALRSIFNRTTYSEYLEMEYDESFSTPLCIEQDYGYFRFYYKPEDTLDLDASVQIIDTSGEIRFEALIDDFTNRTYSSGYKRFYLDFDDISFTDPNGDVVCIDEVEYRLFTDTTIRLDGVKFRVKIAPGVP